MDDPHELNHDVLRIVRRRVDPNLERSVIPRILVQGCEGAGSETQVTPTLVQRHEERSKQSSLLVLRRLLVRVDLGLRLSRGITHTTRIPNPSPTVKDLLRDARRAVREDHSQDGT